ncbi:hypothetical protein B1B_02334 [mine drainage metagenome]|uniref:Uncharacterized protein n=1 Tax=mine drainage metagenome TaxID=410659 RepID=T1BQD7_9ZZZZ
MPFLVWKTIGGKRRLVMRWNRRIDGKPRVTKEIYIGDMERLARMIENPLEDVDAYSLELRDHCRHPHDGKGDMPQGDHRCHGGSS